MWKNVRLFWYIEYSHASSSTLTLSVTLPATVALVGSIIFIITIITIVTLHRRYTSCIAYYYNYILLLRRKRLRNTDTQDTQVDNISWNKSYGLVTPEPQYSTIDYSEMPAVSSDSAHPTESPPTDSAYYIRESDIERQPESESGNVYDSVVPVDDGTISLTTPTDLIPPHTYLSIIGGVVTT